jgi:hypothetical protein
MANIWANSGHTLMQEKRRDQLKRKGVVEASAGREPIKSFDN